MNSSGSNFQLWSPPLLDLSLDSFSNDLFQEFDKKRLNLDESPETTKNSSHQSTTKPPNDHTISVSKCERLEVTEEKGTRQVEIEETETNIVVANGEEEEEQDAEEDEDEAEEQEPHSTTNNLFRKSSTFLRKKLSTTTGSSIQRSSTISTNNAEEISSIVSRQYPPKPLQYSPIIDPPSDKIISSRNSRDSGNMLSLTEEEREDAPDASASVTTNETEVESIALPPASHVTSNSLNRVVPSITSVVPPTTRTVPTTATAATTTTAKKTSTAPPTPKRRSFFSLRFC